MLTSYNEIELRCLLIKLYDRNGNPAKMWPGEMEKINAFIRTQGQSSLDEIMQYLGGRIPKLNTVSAQTMGTIPLVPGDQRTSETDWSGTVLDPIYAHCGCESDSAIYLGEMLKWWFINVGTGQPWFTGKKKHHWRDVYVSIYARN